MTLKWLQQLTADWGNSICEGLAEDSKLLGKKAGFGCSSTCFPKLSFCTGSIWIALISQGGPSRTN